MTPRISHRLFHAPLAGLIGMLLASGPVSAQENPSRVADLPPEQVEAAVRYALPIAIEGAMKACAATLAADGFLAREGDALRERTSEGSGEAWPAARELLIRLMSEETDRGDSISPDLAASLPDENLRPFVGGVILVLVEEEIRPKDCADVERGLELLAPLPPENMAGLVAFLYELAQNHPDPAAMGEAKRAHSPAQGHVHPNGPLDATKDQGE